MIKWKINPLVLLKDLGYTQTYLKKNNIFSGATIDYLRSCEGNITLKTLNTICLLTNSQPADLIEYVDD